jgi:MFS family permease
VAWLRAVPARGGGLFCIQLDFFSLGLALPTIAVELGTTVTDLQWALSGYMIALGALLIPAGRLGDVLGRREVVLSGIALFGLSSLVCGLASSVPLLVGARVVQGVGAALTEGVAATLLGVATLLLVAGLATLAAEWPRPARRSGVGRERLSS